MFNMKAAIVRQDKEVKRVLKVLEAAANPHPLPPSKAGLRVVTGFSLSIMSVVRLKQITKEIQARVVGKVSKSGVLDYLVRHAPPISPEEFVKDSTERRRGRGIPRHELKDGREPEHGRKKHKRKKTKAERAMVTQG